MKILIIFLFLFLIESCSQNEKQPVIITNNKTDTVIVQKQVSIDSNIKAVANSEKPPKTVNPAPKIKELPPVSVKEEPNPYKNSKISYNIIYSEEGTFGYEIQIDGKPMIRQPNIPGLPGNKGFINKERAEKTAHLVISKIKQNIMPPTITIEELDSLGVIK